MTYINCAIQFPFHLYVFSFEAMAASLRTALKGVAGGCVRVRGRGSPAASRRWRCEPSVLASGAGRPLSSDGVGASLRKVSFISLLMCMLQVYFKDGRGHATQHERIFRRVLWIASFLRAWYCHIGTVYNSYSREIYGPPRPKVSRMVCLSEPWFRSQNSTRACCFIGCQSLGHSYGLSRLFITPDTLTWSLRREGSGRFIGTTANAR